MGNGVIMHFNMRSIIEAARKQSLVSTMANSVYYLSNSYENPFIKEMYCLSALMAKTFTEKKTGIVLQRQRERERER